MHIFEREITEEFKYAIESLGYSLRDIYFELTKNIEYGDICTNVALKLSSKYNLEIKSIAGAIAKKIKHKCIKKLIVEENGFINMVLEDKVFDEYYEYLVSKQPNVKKNRGWKYIEIVSANPTGYLHIGHTRSGIFSDTLSNLLERIGYSVRREYLVNNAGGQIKELIESIWYKWRLKTYGTRLKIEKKVSYSGSDIEDCFRFFWTRNRNHWFMEEENIQDSPQYPQIKKMIVDWFLNEIKKDLEVYKIKVDLWKYEDQFVNEENINKIFRDLDGYVRYKDGATWLVYEDKNEVLIKKNGEHTYFLQDIIYHKHKLLIIGSKDEIINVLGSDHYGHIEKMHTYLKAASEDESKIKFVCLQLVKITENGKSVKMSKRNSTVIFMKDLEECMSYEEVRWFFASQSPNSILEIDISKLKEKNYNNPVYYVMYAYSRIHQILKKTTKNFEEPVNFKSLEEKEREIMNLLISYETTLEKAAQNLEPHRITQYLYKLAQLFHSYYEETNVLNSENDKLIQRLAILNATQKTIRDGLEILRIKARDVL